MFLNKVKVMFERKNRNSKVKISKNRVYIVIFKKYAKIHIA